MGSRRPALRTGRNFGLSAGNFDSTSKQLTVLSQAFAQVAYKHRNAKLLLVGDWDCDNTDPRSHPTDTSRDAGRNLTGAECALELVARD